jgi:hypothetical protein
VTLGNPFVRTRRIYPISCKKPQAYTVYWGLFRCQRIGRTLASHTSRTGGLPLGIFNNLILCQITSKAATSNKAIPLKTDHFDMGGLGIDSYVRPDKLFTVEQSVVEGKIGRLQTKKINDIRAEIRTIFG